MGRRARDRTGALFMEGRHGGQRHEGWGEGTQGPGVFCRGKELLEGRFLPQSTERASGRVVLCTVFPAAQTLSFRCLLFHSIEAKPNRSRERFTALTSVAEPCGPAGPRTHSPAGRPAVAPGPRPIAAVLPDGPVARPALGPPSPPHGPVPWDGTEQRSGAEARPSLPHGEGGRPAVRGEPAVSTRDGAMRGITLQVTSPWGWLLSPCGAKAHQLAWRHMGLELALDGLVIKL